MCTIIGLKLLENKVLSFSFFNKWVVNVVADHVNHDLVVRSKILETSIGYYKITVGLALFSTNFRIIV